MRASHFLLAALLALGAADRAPAAVPADLAALANYLPENVRSVLSVRLTPAVRDWLIGALPLDAATSKKLVTEQMQKFAQGAGFNPMEDVTEVSLAMAPGPRADLPSLFAYVQTKTDAAKVGKALKDDPKARTGFKAVDLAGGLVLQSPPLEYGFAGKVILVGLMGTVRPILERAAAPPGNQEFLNQLPAAALDSSVVYVALSVPQSSLATTAVTQLDRESVSHLKTLSVAGDAKQLQFLFQLDSKEQATGAGERLKKACADLKGNLDSHGAFQPASDSSPAIEAIQPRVLLARVLALSLAEAVKSAQVVTEAEVARIEVPREKIPLLKPDSVGLTLGVATVSSMLAGLINARARAELDECLANQRHLTGALELYNGDKKKSAKLEEVANELVSTKYLESKPDDPGQGAGTFGNYFTASDGTVYCKVHSERTPPPVPPAAPVPSPKPGPSPR
jgi:hypothetical protein